MNRGLLSGKFIILFLAFVAVIGVGRLLFYAKPPSSESQNKDQTQNQSAQSASNENTQQKTETPSVKSDQSASSETVSSCAQALKTKTQTQKTNYERGSIIVGFTSEITYDQAKDVLAIYGLVVQDEVHAKEYYGSQRLITAAVTPGEEFTKVCLVKRDARIRYAGLNTLFSLHQ